MPELIFLAVLAVIICTVMSLRNNPFHYPYFKMSFDVSHKRNPDITQYINEYLTQYGFDAISDANRQIEQWHKTCENRIHKSIFKRYRYRQYSNVSDDRNAFLFEMTRQQTRYQQKNYVKQPYKVTVIDSRYRYSFKQLESMYNALVHEKERNEQERQAKQQKKIEQKEHAKQQRNLCTRELRMQVMRRDNYTCQICGRYMPDEVGLHVDHIIPVSKGGMTAMDNLQVLCSKCNGRKSAKITAANDQSVPAVNSSGWIAIDRSSLLRKVTFHSVEDVVGFAISELKTDPKISVALGMRASQAGFSDEQSVTLAVRLFCKLLDERKI